LSSPKISRPNLDRIIAQAEREFPYECCGFIIGHEQSEEVRPIANIQNVQHAKDPTAFPRDARTAFLMDPRQHLAVMREIDDRKLALKIVYHSHPDHEAYFSPTDRRQACSFDPDYPDYPETAYVVISIMGGRFNRVAAFVWDVQKKEFAETELTIE
jgi:proteasome lid subunit RPN8/RPN11